MTTRTHLPKAAQALHLRIGRIVIDAPASADRVALARTLAREVPRAVEARLTARHDNLRAQGTHTISERIADAVAERLQPAGNEAPVRRAPVA